jgi:hypothetical protein
LLLSYILRRSACARLAVSASAGQVSDDHSSVPADAAKLSHHGVCDSWCCPRARSRMGWVCCACLSSFIESVCDSPMKASSPASRPSAAEMPGRCDWYLAPDAQRKRCALFCLYAVTLLPDLGEVAHQRVRLAAKPDLFLAEPDQSSYAFLALRQQLPQHGGQVPNISIARDSVALDCNNGHTSDRKWLACPAQP